MTVIPSSPVEAWECRFVVRELPEEFSADRIARKLGLAVTGEIAERDVYVLGGDRSANIKLRRRPNTLKVKVLRSRAEDGLERWQTTTDAQLPAPEIVWRSVLRLVDVEPDVSSLAACPGFDAAVATLARLAPTLPLVRVEKRRVTLPLGETKLEVATFIVRGEAFQSLAVESQDAQEIRALITTLDPRVLGRPTNYMDVLSGRRV